MSLDEYIKELKEDTVINEINLKEKSLALPALKAKWVSRLINQKNALNDLERKKKRLINKLLPKVRETLPVKLSDSVIKDTAENTHEIKEINEKIEQIRKTIDFLEKTEKVISSMTYDIGNIVKVIQLETL